MIKGPLCQGCPRFNEPRCPPAAQDAARRCDVLIVAEQPDDKSASAGRALFGHGGAVVNKAIDAVMDSEPVYRGLDVRKTYAVQCMSPDDTAPNKEVMAQCSSYLNGLIGAWKPKVLIVLGGTAFKQLGFKLQFNDSRGKMYTHASTGTPVLVTFSEKALVAAPGVYATFLLDLRNAFKRALYGEAKAKTLEELSKDYILPKTVDESLAVCDLICNYARSGDPSAWAISFDTETTTLRPEKASARIIAFCFAWDSGKAATILYDHPHAPDEFLVRRAELRDAIQRVLASSKPKLAHNLKFDAKFVMLKEQFTINNLMWCTLLGEHLLDEDKRGVYGLKALTASFLPDYVGYEDRLYDLLQAEEGISEAEEMHKEIEDQADILAEDHPAFLEALTKHHAELVAYEQKSPAEQAALAAYVRAMEDYAFKRSYHKGRVAVWEVEVADWPKGKRGKPAKPKWGVSKPDRPAVSKKPKRPEDPRSKKERQVAKDAGYENVPIHELQLYGAIDADVTRQLTSIQRGRIKQEQSKVGPLMRTHAVPASLVLGRMEYYGTRVDQEYIPVLEEGLRKIAESTERELYAMAGRVRNDRAINLNSPATLCDVLFSWGWTHPDGKVVTYTPVEKTKKGAFSTAEKVIRAFIDYDDDAKTVPSHDALFAVRLLEWRKSSKALNTFLANVRALSKRDGFLHTQFHLNGTGTGRLSCIAGSVIIDTSEGSLPVSEITPEKVTSGLAVLTHSGTWRRILRVFTKGKDPLFLVQTTSGKTVVCTADHWFRTPAGWQRLRDLGIHSVLTVCEDVGRGVFGVDEIVAITPQGVGLVWDLEVEGDHSYVAQGFVNHNSSDMNMQNIPKFLASFNIKKLFVPDNDDYVIVNVDWKGAEVRVFTAYAHDPALIDALNRGLDMHSFFAHKVFDRPYEHYDRRDDDVFLPDKAYRKKLDLERSRIKRVVFGILYGAGPSKIAETINVSEDVARELIDLLYAMFPAIKQYAIDIEQEVLSKGWVETHFGRRRRFPLARLSRHRGRAVRQARNFKIQSTSSDIVIGQLIEMDQPLRDLGGRLLLTVHDSIVMQFPKKHLGKLKEFIHYYAEKRVGEKYPWLPVPFRVDIEVGPNYGECQPIDKYLAKHAFTPVLEGVVEENEILAELRDDAFSGEAAAPVQ